MMRISSFFVGLYLLFHFPIHAQDVTNDGVVYFQGNVMEYLPIKHEVKVGIRQVTYELKSKNNVSTFIKRLDEKGRPISYHRVQENGEEQLMQSVSYSNQDHVLIETNCDKKGRINRIRTNTWNENGTISKIHVVDGKGSILTKIEFEYDAQKGCLTAVKTYQKGGEKILETWYHEYDEECKKTRSILRKGNDKIIREINYACSGECEVTDPKKNETQVCTWDESSANFLMKVYQTQDNKGKMHRTIQKLTRLDSSLVELLSYNAEDELSYRETYDGSFSRPLHLYSYHKGEVIYERIRTYQNEQIASQIILQKGKNKNKTTYAYDSNNQLTNTATFDNKDRLIRSIQITYQ
jgi:antitoxin component YwqK of YwqJK toxin-antitoxin module